MDGKMFNVVGLREPNSFVRYVVLASTLEEAAEKVIKDTETPYSRLWARALSGDIQFIDPNFFTDDPEAMIAWFQHTKWKMAITFAGKLTWAED